MHPEGKQGIQGAGIALLDNGAIAELITDHLAHLRCSSFGSLDMLYSAALSSISCKRSGWSSRYELNSCISVLWYVPMNAAEPGTCPSSSIVIFLSCSSFQYQ